MVRQVDVYVVGAQSRQRVLDFAQDVITRQAGVVRSGTDGFLHFGGDDQLISLAFDRLGENLFGAPGTAGAVGV